MIELRCWIDRESHLQHIQEQEATPEEAAEYLRQELVAEIHRANLQPLIAAITTPGQSATCLVQVRDPYTRKESYDTL